MSSHLDEAIEAAKRKQAKGLSAAVAALSEANRTHIGGLLAFVALEAVLSQVAERLLSQGFPAQIHRKHVGDVTVYVGQRFVVCQFLTADLGIKIQLLGGGRSALEQWEPPPVADLPTLYDEASKLAVAFVSHLTGTD